MSDRERSEAATGGSTAGEGEDLAARIGEASRQLELQDPDLETTPLDRAINRMVDLVAFGLLSSILLIVFANAFSRYILRNPLPWASEVVLALMPWLAMVGLFLSVRRRRMIRITFLIEKLSPPAQAVLAALGQLLCCMVFGYLAWLALAHTMMFGADRTPYLGFAKGWSYAAMAVMGALVALAFVAELCRDQGPRWRARRQARREACATGERRP
jgi:TRAP-type C4-dicarboxylate transport system permease small subunit